MSNVIPDIVTRHAEEASFLWLLRRRAVKAPHYSLTQIAELDERIEAHLDGLRIAGDAGWMIIREQLEATPEQGETFAAGVLALESRSTERIEVVREVGLAVPSNESAFVSALGWLSPATAGEYIGRWYSCTDVVLRRAAIAGVAIHRLDLVPVLLAALDDPDDGVQARALRAVGELGNIAALPIVRRLTNHPDLACRFWASWSAARLGDRSATPLLLQFAEVDGAFRAHAVQLIVRMQEPVAARRWLRLLQELPGGARLAIQGTGWLGDPAAGPDLLDAISNPALARLAGEALTMITGVDLEDAKLDGPRPPGFDAGPTDDAEDENVEMDPDDDLPWPDVARVRDWWAANRGRFSPGTRYLLGKPMTSEWLREVWRTGRQRHRIAAALELAIREPNKPLLEWRAPGFRQ